MVEVPVDIVGNDFKGRADQAHHAVGVVAGAATLDNVASLDESPVGLTAVDSSSAMWARSSARAGRPKAHGRGGGRL